MAYHIVITFNEGLLNSIISTYLATAYAYRTTRGRTRLRVEIKLKVFPVYLFVAIAYTIYARKVFGERGIRLMSSIERHYYYYYVVRSGRFYLFSAIGTAT